MSFLKWSIPARLYFIGICLIGWSVFGMSVVSLLEHRHLSLAHLSLPLSLALAGRMLIQLPNCDGRITPTGLIVMYAGLSEGVEFAVILASLEALLSSMKQSRDRLQRIAFNMGVLPLATFVAMTLTDFMLPGHGTLLLRMERALALAILYYALNMGMVLGMMVLVGGQKALQSARSALLWSWAEYGVGGTVAGLLTFWDSSLQLVLFGCMTIVFLTSRTLQHYFAVLRQKTQALEQNAILLHDKEQLVEEVKATHMASLETLALAIEAKDPTTHGHVRRVQVAADLLGKALELDAATAEALHIAALVHDIGKLAIPEYVLYQDSKQSPDDLARYRTHAAVGADILRASRLDPMVQMVRHHHERFDGQGYPDGLKGTNIPMGARVLAVADTYDKLRHPRLGMGRTHAEACAHIAALAGEDFDPGVVAVFTACASSIEEALSPKPLTPSTPQALALDESKSTLLQGMQSSHAEAMTLHTLTRELQGSLDPSAIMRHMAKVLSQTAPWDALLFLLPEDRDGRLAPAFTLGPINDGVVASTQLWLQKYYKRQNTALTVFERPGAELGENEGLFRAWVVFPLQIDNHAAGLVVLYQCKPTYYTDTQRRLIQLVLENGGPTLTNARAYDRFQRESTLDELTGLGNARFLRTHAEGKLLSALEQGEECCAVMLDLNGFKAVNDTLGHHAGDKLLVEVSRILQRNAFPPDLLIRNGGDEFVMFLSGYSVETVAARLETIYAEACAIWPLSRERASIGTSFGVAWLREDGETVETLMQVADTRMYDDKHRKNGHRRSEVARVAS